MAGLNLVSNLPNIYDNVAPNGSLNTNAAAMAILQYCNIPLPESNLSPAQVLFHRQLHVHLPVKPCYYHLHTDWIISSKQREVILCSPTKPAKKRKIWLYVTQEHPALEVGTNVVIRNTRNSAKSRWEKTGTTVEKVPFG